MERREESGCAVWARASRLRSVRKAGNKRNDSLPTPEKGGAGGRESPGRVLVVWTVRAAGSPAQEPSQKPERFFLVPVRGKESTPTRFCVGCQATQWCGLAAVRRTCHVDCVLQMNNEVIIADFTRDVRESEIPGDVLQILLADRTTGKNILWMTDGYAALESIFDRPMSPRDEIVADVISRPGSRVIRPRVDKSKAEQRERVQKKAEVFTPSWICNNMLNDADAAWFDRKSSPFTTQGSRAERWTRLPGKIAFPDAPERSWLDYVNDRRLEMCCGEAPFLASRYDTTTGEVIPVPERIGILDRKLRVVTENAGTDSAEWLKHAILALKATLGFEWQGDNLLIARENILYTMLEHYKFYCTDEPLPHATLLELADIISWNIWQMDGLKCVVPMTCHDEVFAPPKPKAVQMDLFAAPEREKAGKELPLTTPCPGCACKKPLDGIFLHNGLYCNVMDWEHNRPYRYADIIRDNMERQRQRKNAKP